MVQIENLPLVLTGFGLTASILYYTMTLRNANKTQQLALENRQAQLFMQLWSKATSNEGIEASRILSEANWTSYEE